MASRPPPPPHLRLDLPLFSPRLPPLGSSRCRRGRSRRLSALPSPSPPSRSQRVSTASLEHGPGPGSTHRQPRRDPALDAEVARLSAARARLRAARSLDDKLRALDSEPRVADFFGEASGGGVLGALEPREVFLLKCLVAAGQEHVLGAEFDWAGGSHEHYRDGGGGGGALREALYSLAGFGREVELEGSGGGRGRERGDGDAPAVAQVPRRHRGIL